MIEIPEAANLAGQLVQRCGGKAVAGVTAGQSPHKFAWFYGDPAGYQGLAAGAVISGARAVGGMVEGEAGDLRLLFSEGANPRYHAPGAKPPQKHQLFITFSDGSALSVTVRMYGGMGIFPAGTLDNEYYLIADRAPSPLSPAFDRRYFDGLLQGPGVDRLSAKALLATEQRIPGLGNGVLQDILFRAGVHPKSRVEDVTAAQRDRLFGAIGEVLAGMAAAGGRDTELDLDGNPGGYRTLMCRNTEGTPCPVCGAPIEKASYMGGSIYFCPACQPLRHSSR